LRRSRRNLTEVDLLVVRNLTVRNLTEVDLFVVRFATEGTATQWA
jgi:hypothetical protein